jgi:nitrite reductase (NO-forming)
MASNKTWLILLIFFAAILTACRPQTGRAERIPDQLVEFSLLTDVQEGRIVYLGVSGEIEGLVNPDLVVPAGARVRVKLINGDGMHHNISFPDFNALSALISSKGSSTELSFNVPLDKVGVFSYFCTQPGHRQAGQEGKLIVTSP